MGWIDVAIPGGIGLMLVLKPEAFTKAEGEEGVAARSKLRKIGFGLLGVAALYIVAKVLEGR